MGLPRARRNGLALIIVVGILAVTAILSACFLTLARLERRASQQRLHQTQAHFLARSGIEDALARLDAGQDALASGNAYQGEDWDGNGQISAFEAQQEAFHRTGAGTTPDTLSCPLDQAMRPSFFVRVPGSDNPDIRSVTGRQRGYSGQLAGGGSATRDATLAYALKVEDESGKINVNGGFLDAMNRDGDGSLDYCDPNVRLTTAAADNGLGWNRQLCRILGVLGQEPELGMPVTFGTDVLTRRPLGGYVSIAQLQILVGTTTDLSPYLTTSSWIDRKVVQPNGWAHPGQNAMNEVKKVRTPLALDPAGRPPVNLNTASRPVLRALMRGVKGFNCYPYPFPYVVELSPSAAGSAAVVDTLVSEMLTRRAVSPFRGWADFSAFCDTLPPLVPAGFYGVFSQLMLSELIKANFDPNTALNKDLPDQLKFRFLDKSDLMVWSTEGCFEPTGVFRITGLGRIRGGDGKILAERSLGVTVRIHELLRQTTQKDFLADRRLDECHSLSSMGAVLHTTGAGASWKTWGGSVGLSTLSYPNPPAVASADATDFDGYLGLATVEAGPPSPAVGGTLMFLHHLDDDWTADSAVAPLRVTPGPSDSKLTSPLTGSVWPTASGVEPNTLRPDGLHIQRDRCPAFLATNMPASTSSGANRYNRGVIGLWVKPTSFNNFNYDFSSTKGDGPNNTQVLLMGRNSNVTWGILMENRQESVVENGVERQESLAAPPRVSMRHPMLRWTLETGLFDTDETLSGQELRFDLRLFPSHGATDTGYPVFNVTASSDLFEFDVTPGMDALIVLGCPGPTRAPAGVGGPDCHTVIDEVCICDFGDLGSSAVTRMGTWAAERFNDGRYYKENDARFLSAPMSPMLGEVRLRWARWTAYLPCEGRKEIATMPFTQAVDRLLDTRLSNSAVELELLDSAGSFTSAPLQALTQGGAIGRTLDSFRYRVTFKPNLPSLSDPVLESPFLDDVTFAWQPASGPRILAWSDR